MAKAVLQTADDLLLCNECGTQYPVTEDSGKDECKVCDVRAPTAWSSEHLTDTVDRLGGSEAVRSSHWTSLHYSRQVEVARLQKCLVARQAQSECLVCED